MSQNVDPNQPQVSPTTGTNQDGVVASSENALVPMNEDGRPNQEEGAEDNIPEDMVPLMEEMESVLYSISFGKQESVGRTKYQAFSAAISNQTHVDLVLNYIASKRGIA